MSPPGLALDDVRQALDDRAYTSGTTHDFYHYPARFSPDIARAVINRFSKPGDLVLDPFMGGGTSIIEGLTLGRRMLGIDLNALAHFIADVRTTPLSTNDEQTLRDWSQVAASLLSESDVGWIGRHGVVNLPRPVEVFVAGALALGDDMYPRRLAFARCALLRLGQWALDCRDFAAPRRKRLARQFPVIVSDMLGGLRQLVAACDETGIRKSDIRRNRILVNRSSVGIELDPRVAAIGDKPTLVFTSPPYPAVHVLYHRWQYRGRKETSAPYWIANVSDGFGASYYCGGSRTPTGIKNYFTMIEDAYGSVRKIIAENGRVVQLVGFSNASEQLPAYLDAMEAAGFVEDLPSSDEQTRLVRRVPNRKWYAKLKGNVDASSEYLLIHRPK